MKTDVIICALLLGASLVNVFSTLWHGYKARRDMRRFSSKYYPLMQRVARYTETGVEYREPEVSEPRRHLQ